MKITQSISILYHERLIVYEKLRTRVDDLIMATKKNTWHYYSRLKKQESYALKLETGRVYDPGILEDFFACTIVVENLSEIKNAVDYLRDKFKFEYRRPQNDNYTSKQSDSFPFDDLRLYVSLIKVEYLPPSIFDGVVFEIQIKTFLQHAWGIATHDLIYKTDNVNWAKERVAYQIKAILEQAEISISGADGLSQLPELAKENKESKNLNKIVNFITSKFKKELLPTDVLRLSKIVSDTMLNFEITLEQMSEFIEAETLAGRGSNTLNLSPYGIIIQSIINQSPDVFVNAFTLDHKRKDAKIFIPSEISLPPSELQDPNRLIRV